MHPSIRQDGVAVVTGAAMGIGYAIADRLANERMKLVLFDRDRDALANAAEALHRKHPQLQLKVVSGDVSSGEDARRLFEESFRFGEVTLLINNAAIHQGGGPWERLEQWRTLMEVNFWAALTLQHLFVERMLEQQVACAIVNVGSKEGITTPPGNAAYSVSKAALRVLTEQLSHELRQRTSKFTAHLLIPGYTFTPMNFPNMTPQTVKPDAPWAADQVAQRMVEAMGAGHFYLFCKDNEASRLLDERRMQWSADDLIKNRPALSRWHPEYRDRFTEFATSGGPG